MQQKIIPKQTANFKEMASFVSEVMSFVSEVVKDPKNWKDASQEVAEARDLLAQAEIAKAQIEQAMLDKTTNEKKEIELNEGFAKLEEGKANFAAQVKQAELDEAAKEEERKKEKTLQNNREKELDQRDIELVIAEKAAEDLKQAAEKSKAAADKLALESKQAKEVYEKGIEDYNAALNGLKAAKNIVRI